MFFRKGPIARHFTGQVSRASLLTRVVPLSFTSFFASIAISAWFFPGDYDWRIHVMSKLTSHRDNPQAFWVASLGIFAAMVFIFPFGGYVARNLRAIHSKISTAAGLTFALGFVIMAISMIAQLFEIIFGFSKLHRYLAETAAGFLIFGMLCCSVCAVKDLFERFSGRRVLSRELTTFWISLTIIPLLCVAALGASRLFGGEAEAFRQSFRNTPLWHLAFWEWVGTILAYIFISGSVALLPTASRQESAQTGSSGNRERDYSRVTT